VGNFGVWGLGNSGEIFGVWMGNFGVGGGGDHPLPGPEKSTFFRLKIPPHFPFWNCEKWLFFKVFRPF
jgi:hypothetical protein